MLEPGCERGDYWLSSRAARKCPLWLAGKAQNWDVAEYERHNIGGALARITTAIPTYKDQSTADLIAAAEVTTCDHPVRS
jgi:hypothetical protein